MGSAKVLGENEDVVRIMSIHKSKGLEGKRHAHTINIKQ